jgi:hypothetical protein
MAASWMRMQGADIHTVAQLLGHKDLRMAAGYQHLSPAFLVDHETRCETVPPTLNSTSTQSVVVVMVDISGFFCG